MLRTLLIALALVAATAGTATAASKVLIKSSAQVKNGSLDAADLSAKARKALQGKAGPAGPAGAPGAPGAPGATGARGPSEAFAARGASINGLLCPPDGCDSGATLRSLSVPAGSYLVTASADLLATTFAPDTTRSLECHVERADTGTFQRTLHLHRTGATVGTSDQTVQVTWAVTLPEPTTLNLTCSVGTVKFNASNARITALQVGTLTETVS